MAIVRRQRPRASRRSLWSAAGALAAIGAPAVMWAEFIGWGSATPGYDLRLRAASDLAMVGAPHRVEFSIGFFFVAGGLTVVVALALWQLLPRGRGAAATALLVAVEGLALIATGLIPVDPGSAEQTASHQFASSISFFAAALAPLAAAVALPGPGARLRRASLALGALLIAIYAAGYLLRGSTHIPDGVFQRPFGIVLTAWFLLAALALRRLRVTASG